MSKDFLEVFGLILLTYTVIVWFNPGMVIMLGLILYLLATRGDTT